MTKHLLNMQKCDSLGRSACGSFLVLLIHSWFVLYVYTQPLLCQCEKKISFTILKTGEIVN